MLDWWLHVECKSKNIIASVKKDIEKMENNRIFLFRFFGRNQWNSIWLGGSEYDNLKITYTMLLIPSIIEIINFSQNNYTIKTFRNFTYLHSPFFCRKHWLTYWLTQIISSVIQSINRNFQIADNFWFASSPF